MNSFNFLILLSQVGHMYTDWTVHCVNNTFPLKILDLTDNSTGITTNFICNHLDMPHTCEYTRKIDRSGLQTHLNSHETSLHPFFDSITFRASQRAWIDTNKYSRPEVRTALGNYTESVLKLTPFELDRDCPTDKQLEEYLQESLRVERNVFGVEAAALRENETRSAFQRRAQEKFFCGVDSEAVLDRPEFKSFFEAYH